MLRSPEEEEFCATRGRLKAKLRYRPACATGATRGHLPVYLCYEEPLKGKAVLREAFKRQCCATVPFRGGFCAARANEGQPEQRPERRRGFCATSACRRGFCATGDRKRPLLAQDCLESPSRSTGLPVGFCFTFNTISMGNGPVRGKSWGGLHGRLPIAQIGLESAARRTGLPLTARHQRGRKVPFGQPERHQGGRKGFIGQLARHQGSRKGSMREDSLGSTREAPGRQERIHWTACEAPGRQERIHWTACERGTREAPGRQERTIWTAWDAPEAPGRQEERHQGGYEGLQKRILCYEGLSKRKLCYEGHSATARAQGLRVQSTDWPLKCRSEHRIACHRDAPGRQERTIWTA